MFQSYLAAIGQIDTFLDDTYTSFVSLIMFIIMTLVVPVTMLNLIIAIIGNTYNKVHETELQTLYKVRAEMCVENVYLVPDQDRKELWRNRFTQ
jgi:hypothetical protein